MNRRNSPLLVVLSGPSGVGKDSLIQELRRTESGVAVAVTATTRLPRPGEVDGTSYHFFDRARFDQLLDSGELVAAAQVHGNWYGAPLDEIRKGFAAGKDVILRIDVQGAMQMRRRFPQAVFIFLAPASLDDLVDRLQHRRTESEEELSRRIRDARDELDQALRYDYVVVNQEDGLDDAVHAVRCIITAERLRTHRQAINLG